MSRVFAVVFVVAALAAIHQTAVGANGSAVPSAPSGGGGSSMPVITPEQIAANAYNSGISHKNKGLKLEADAAKATKDREKILGKAKDEYGKALSLAPGFPDALEYRGEAYLALNRIDDAKAAYLELFAKDREQAGQLMKAMTDWVATRQTDPAGVDPGTVAAFDTWIKERAKVAALTSNMSLASNHSAWR